MTRLTFYACRKMSAMSPIYSRDHLVNTHPGNLLVGCGVLSDFLYGGLVRRDRDMALHALSSVGKSHQLARFRIGVALSAFQTESQVLFVTIGDRLLWRGVRARIVGHFKFCGCVRAGACGFMRGRLGSGLFLCGATGHYAKQYK